jgi:hypothetical protein
MKARHVDVGLVCRSRPDHKASGWQSVGYINASHLFGQGKKTEIAIPVRDSRENQAKWPIFC